MQLKAQLASGLHALLGRLPTEQELGAFSHYLALLLRWNRVHSLTAYREPEEIVDKLFLDSLLFLRLLPPHTSRLLDLGSGAGIPGIPIKIVEPAWSMTLIEARRRRSSFLASAVRELALQDIRVLTGRAETLIKDFPDLDRRFDAVVTRASGKVEAIVRIALPFLRPGGRFIASGPPVTKPFRGNGLESWQIVTSPLSGRPRRFLVIEKT